MATKRTRKPTPTVEVWGPNLRSKTADFHVHAAGCADTAKGMYKGHTPAAYTDPTLRDIVEDVYVDIIAENESTTWEDYVGEFKIFPCAVIVDEPAAAPAAAAAAADSVELTPWHATLVDLTAVQVQIDEKNLSERRDAADPLMVRRNELILAAIEQGAGFAEIARARGVSSSTNRGLIRVLQGGKRI